MWGLLGFQDVYEFVPTDMSTLSIIATHFLAKGVIRLASSSTPTPPVSVTITSKKTGQSSKAKTKEHEKGVLSYEIKGASGDTLKIEPNHPTLLFFPESIQVGVSMLSEGGEGLQSISGFGGKLLHVDLVCKSVVFWSPSVEEIP